MRGRVRGHFAGARKFGCGSAALHELDFRAGVQPDFRLFALLFSPRAAKNGRGRKTRRTVFPPAGISIATMQIFFVIMVNASVPAFSLDASVLA